MMAAVVETARMGALLGGRDKRPPGESEALNFVTVRTSIGSVLVAFSEQLCLVKTLSPDVLMV